MNRWEFSTVTEKILASRLPLLIADGYPSDLKRITLNHLRSFIFFMINCSSGYDIKRHFVIEKPLWWPPNLLFPCGLFLYKDAPPENELEFLKFLVRQCYAYHRCNNLLRISSILADFPVDRLMFKDNCDGTSSLIDTSTGKLILKLRNENREYDFHFGNTWKKLSSKMGLIGSKSSKTSETTTNDVYSCPKCRVGINSFKEIQEHKKMCFVFENGEKSLHPDGRQDGLLRRKPDQTILYRRKPKASNKNRKEELLFRDQAQFLSNVALRPLEDCIEKEADQKTDINMNGCTNISVSFPLGKIALLDTINTPAFKFYHNSDYEHYCSSKDYHEINGRKLRAIPSELSWPVMWRNTGRRNEDIWTHLYSFTKRQKEERLRTIATGLNKKSRFHLKQCKDLRIVLNRLTPEEIDFYTKPKKGVKGAQVKHLNVKPGSCTTFLPNGQCSAAMDKNGEHGKVLQHKLNGVHYDCVVPIVDIFSSKCSKYGLNRIKLSPVDKIKLCKNVAYQVNGKKVKINL